MLFAGWEVRIVKNCDRGLENAARRRRPRATFSSPRSQFFTIRTDPKPVNNLFILFQALKRKKNHGRKLTQALLWPWSEKNPDHAKNQSHCRIRYRARLEKNNLSSHLEGGHIGPMWPTLRWLDSSVGRALHRYRRGHGFESRSGSNFFQALIWQLLKLCV